MTTEVFPEDWKCADVVSRYKRRDGDDPVRFRLVSFTSV